MAELTSNKITADGTYTIPTSPGQIYSLSVAGDFGGGSLAFQWVDASGNAAAFIESPFTTARAVALRAPTSLFQFVLSGSTDPDLTVGLVVSQYSGVAEVVAISADDYYALPIAEQLDTTKIYAISDIV